MKKRTSLAKKILLSVLGFILLIGLAIGVFFLFFFDTFLNDVVRPKLVEAMSTASNGSYQLHLAELSSNDGKLICRKFDLKRVRFDSLYDGVYVKTIAMDSVVLSGLDWWRLLVNKKVELTAVHFNTPTIALGMGTGPQHFDSSKKQTNLQLAESLKDPILSIDTILFNNMIISMPPDSEQKEPPKVKEASIAISHFRLDRDTTHATDFLFFSDKIDIKVPQIRYIIEDSLYTLSMKGLHANLLDSSLTIDTLSYRPNYTDKAFMAKFPIRRDRLDFIWTGIKLEGVELFRLFKWRGIIFRTGSVRDWSFDYYSDKRKPLGPPQQAVYPNEAIRSTGLRIYADSFVLHKGFARVREQHSGSPDQALILFNNIEAVIHPIDILPTDPKKTKATQVKMSTTFLGTTVRADITYPLSQPTFDMDLHTVVGPFNPKKLNQFLGVSDRSEITGGTVESGEVTMKIRNGMANTTVTPKYYGLSLKLLSEKTTEERGIMEGIKTFIYNTFKLHSDNSPTAGEKVKSATTTRQRKKQEEFFQYLWFCIRKSLGNVVGGFE